MAENLMKILREGCSVASYAAGMECYHADSVGRLVKRGSDLQTKVSDYHVTVNFHTVKADAHHPAHDTVQSAHCTCPYSNIGWCKHIVATLLKCHYEPRSISCRPSLNDMLDDMNYAEMRQLVYEMVTSKPGLIEMVDRIYHDDEDEENGEG